MTLNYCARFLLTTFLSFTTITSQIRAEEYNVCSANYTIGPKCNCYENSLQRLSVTCSDLALTSVPTPFPDYHTIILSKNAITEIVTGPFNNLTVLTDLYLQNNYISYIQRGAFSRLMKLENINLANNFLRSVSKDVFSHLPSLSTLDLSSNLITTVDRYSFFYLPSLVLVNMESNLLNCGCEEKFLREFIDHKIGSLSISNSRCGNFGNISITDVPESSWSSLQCEGQYLFRPQGSGKCYSCADAKGLVDCKTRQQNCNGPRDVCYVRQEYSNTEHLGVWSGCIDYKTCIEFEAANSATCKNNTPTTCYFCKNARTFTKLDIANTTRYFNFLALITLSMDMTAGLANNESREYINFVDSFAIEIQNSIYGQKGSFLVEFIDLRAPRVTIAVKITASTMWFISYKDVKSALETKIKRKSFNGKTVETIHILPYHAGWCEADVIQSDIYGTLSWSQVASDTVSVLVCPFQSTSGERNATRYCDTLGVWAATNFTECSAATAISRELQSIAEQDITTDNVENVSSNVNKVSQGWESYKSVDVTLTVDIVEQILNTTSSSPSVITNTIDIINNILFVGTLTLSLAQQNEDAASRLASVIDSFSNSVDAMNDDYTVVKDNVAMFVTNVDNASSFEGRSMKLSSYRDGAFSDDKSTFHTADVATDNSQSGILLRPTLLDGLSAAEQRRVNHISLYALKDSKLYNSITKLNTTTEIMLPGNKTVLATRAINSNVIAATVPGVSINNLKEPVIITFLHFEAGVNAECVYWDDISRDWSSEGCSLNVTTSDLTVCHCKHLTNFALLMDVYGSGGTLTKSDLLALSIISYIGCGVSCLSVILTLLTYSCFKRIKKDNPSKILMNLCGAIGLVNFVFIVGVQDYMIENHTGCKIVAVLLHYLLLAVMCWMMVEAFYMYLALVKVFNTHVAHFQLKSSLFGWGIPLVIVIITLSINKTDNYGIQPGGICWLERIPFYASFLGPVCGTMIVNMVVFILVLRQIFRRSSKKLTKSDSNRGTAVRIRGAISLIILLGLTWLFAILAIGDFGKVFHYLFALTNTLQGLFLFIFYCVLKTEAQNAWKTCLPCFTSPYEKNRSTTATSKENAVQEPLVNAEMASTIQQNIEGYSETENGSKATASMDVTSAASSTIREVKQEPVQKEQEYKHQVQHPEPVFRGNWQMNINTANNRSSFDA